MKSPRLVPFLCIGALGIQLLLLLLIPSTVVLARSGAPPGLILADNWSRTAKIPPAPVAGLDEQRQEGEEEDEDVEEEEIATFIDARAGWLIQYYKSLLQPVVVGDGLTVFIADDRATFVAVDSYLDKATHYGPGGEYLRMRAVESLGRIYGRSITPTDIINPAPEGWTTGLLFTTDRGSKGEALYGQDSPAGPTYRVRGIIYGYKAANEEEILPMLQAVRESFTRLD